MNSEKRLREEAGASTGFSGKLRLRISFRRASLLGLVAVALLASWIYWERLQPAPMPMTGKAVSGLQDFDRAVSSLMVKYDIVGGSLALTKDGKLILARGYGWADKDSNILVHPDSLFRICSISKPITAVAVLKLVEEGKLSLETKAFDILRHLEPPPGQSVVDQRIYDITVRDLLHHRGGWDRNKGFDPMFIPVEAAEALGVPPPADSVTVIRFMLGQQLNFTPGARYAYSNFGYNVLGRVIENVTGQGYEQYVKAAVLEPNGITHMQIGRSLLEDRAGAEVLYYGLRFATSVFPPHDLVPWPYGGFYLEAMDSHGGWIASTIDLVRFVTAVDGTRLSLLKPETVQMMLSPHPNQVVTSSYYACGWDITEIDGDADWQHAGALPGSCGILWRTHDGFAFAVLFNGRPEDFNSFMNELSNRLWNAYYGVEEWPTHDLFAEYP